MATKKAAKKVSAKKAARHRRTGWGGPRVHLAKKAAKKKVAKKA